MMYMNEVEIEMAIRKYPKPEYPNLARAASTLHRLMVWTNRNSDGWPYWPKPARAAKQLMILLQDVDRFNPTDVSEAEVKRALTPIKSFLTRQGVEHSAVISS